MMKKMTVVLPHSYQVMLQNIICNFSQPVLDMNALNMIFFGNKCPFFPLIQQYYPSEALEFLKAYPFLQQLALNINNILPNEIPLLQQMEIFNKIELTRKQVALLFMLSFFGLIPQSANNKLNVFNVSDVLFAKNGTKFEFGRCFLNYLTTIGKWIAQNNPILEEKIIYLRESINRFNLSFENFNLTNLCPVNFIPQGSLINGNSSYCVDFANQYIGGGTLMGGCVQEEILFAINPEAIVAMLFMEKMHECDAIGIFNVIQYSSYEGYKNTFTFTGNRVINCFASQINRKRLIAIDASCRVDPKLNNMDLNNYQQSINRDIYKAYSGFNLINSENMFEKSIATGNWGCGVFGGNPQLKFIEQWIAASFAGAQRLDYFTFNDQNMQYLMQFYQNIMNKFVFANNLYRALLYNRLDMTKLVECLLNWQFQ
jgi:poly(ADP-ribose) glycohydrolase